MQENSDNYIVIEDIGGPFLGNSCILIDFYVSDEKKFRFMVDCGLIADKNDKYNLNLMNRRYEVLKEGIDGIILTHAHLDHVNGLPLLYKK